MAKIAIIGTGIAGLSAAYLLNPDHDITVYEKQASAGGHSRTVTVRHGDRDIPVDTGFIVFNERNYPNLTALFRHLGVAVKNIDMTFGLTVDGGRFEWGAKDLNAIFGQRRNLFRPAFYKLLRQVMRFNASVLDEAERAPNLTLGQLLSRMGLGEAFQRNYILPMAGAIWSCPPQRMLEFPARSFIRFFENHGLLSTSGQPQWLTVSGGAEKYVDRLSAPFADRIRVGCGATRVVRGRGFATISDPRHGETRYDEVVFACHADEALALLADPDEQERKALGAIRYQRNVAVLHKDTGFMPKSRRCWASWVYHSEDSVVDEPAVSLTYWMNNLQGIDERYPLFVTLNPSRNVATEHVFDRHVFMHPVFDFPAFAAQSALREMQGRRNTWYCGAHLGHGFHEDGLASAMRVAEAMGATVPWVQGAAARTIGRAQDVRSYGHDGRLPAESVLQPSAG